MAKSNAYITQGRAAGRAFDAEAESNVKAAETAWRKARKAAETVCLRYIEDVAAGSAPNDVFKGIGEALGTVAKELEGHPGLSSFKAWRAPLKGLHKGLRDEMAPLAEWSADDVSTFFEGLDSFNAYRNCHKAAKPGPEQKAEADEPQGADETPQEPTTDAQRADSIVSILRGADDPDAVLQRVMAALAAE